jgi:photosystem II stability/assembly factor-like uncharacterized protein
MRWGALVVLLLAAAGCASSKTKAVGPWQALEISTDASFNDLWFVDDRQGWVVGGGYDVEGGIIGRTTDGGVTWRFASGFVGRWPGVIAFSMNAVQFLDSLRGCAVASGGQIFLTRDGGENWRAVRNGAGEALGDVHFVDEYCGWAVGGAGVLRTTDGGETWQWAVRSSSENGYLSGSAVQFLDRRFGWMVGHQGVWRTGDGGLTWTRATLPLARGENPHLYDLHFVDPSTGWVVGENGTILHTADGGHTWARQSNGIPAPKPRPLHIVRRQNGVDTFDLEGPPPGLCFSAVRFLDAQRGWAVGYFPVEGRSLVLHTDDGGATWAEEAEAPGEELRAIFLLRDGRAWAIGDRARLGAQTLLRRSPPAL